MSLSQVKGLSSRWPVHVESQWQTYTITSQCLGLSLVPFQVNWLPALFRLLPNSVTHSDYCFWYPGRSDRTPPAHRVAVPCFGLITAFCRHFIYWLGLLGASLCIGFTASVTQQIIPAAASLASDNRRGAIIGSVMSGLLSGMLLSRILAGFIATHYGWRAMFWLGIPLVLAGAAAMALLLPLSRPSASMKYGLLLRSLLQLWREESRLRRAP